MTRCWALATAVIVAMNAPCSRSASAGPSKRARVGAVLRIIDRPIRFTRERIDLTKRYILKHYGLRPKTIRIVPRAIVVHWTATPTTRSAWRTFNSVLINRARKHVLRGGKVNVSAQFLVARNGTIYRLMPETWMARHCIGLNYDSIGIENVGGGKRWPLTRAQLRANARLIRYLVKRYKKIRYMLGHMEWKRFEKAPFFRELDPTYRNAKPDPGRRFLRKLRRAVADLKLRSRYVSPRQRRAISPRRGRGSKPQGRRRGRAGGRRRGAMGSR